MLEIELVPNKKNFKNRALLCKAIMLEILNLFLLLPNLKGMSNARSTLQPVPPNMQPDEVVCKSHKSQIALAKCSHALELDLYLHNNEFLVADIANCELTSTHCRPNQLTKFYF